MHIAESCAYQLCLSPIFLSCAGGCEGLLKLAETKEAVKSCMLCCEPIAGVLRYGRITNKRNLDLLDNKCAAELHHTLYQAHKALQNFASAPDVAARKHHLNAVFIGQIGAQLQAIVQQCTSPPSVKVISVQQPVSSGGIMRTCRTRASQELWANCCCCRC